PRGDGKRAIDRIGTGMGADRVPLARLGRARDHGAAFSRNGSAPAEGNCRPTGSLRVGGQPDVPRYRGVHAPVARKTAEVVSVTSLSTRRNSAAGPDDGVMPKEIVRDGLRDTTLQALQFGFAQRGWPCLSHHFRRLILASFRILSSPRAASGGRRSHSKRSTRCGLTPVPCVT